MHRDSVAKPSDFSSDYNTYLTEHAKEPITDFHDNTGTINESMDLPEDDIYRTLTQRGFDLGSVSTIDPEKEIHDYEMTYK